MDMWGERLTASKSFVAGRLVVVVAALTAMALPASAMAHTERASYFPDPAPDCSVTPCAGGQIPTVRSLASAAYEDRGSTRVVCKPNSLRRAQRSITLARTSGYVLRPSVGTETITVAEGHRLMDANRKLFMHCRFRSIQDAVNASGNNDRVVIMPGVYTEPESRAAPTNDPSC